MTNVIHLTDIAPEPSAEPNSGLPVNLTPELLRAFMALNIQFGSRAGLDNVAYLATMGQIASSTPNASGDDTAALTAEFGSISREAATLSAAMNRSRA